MKRILLLFAAIAFISVGAFAQVQTQPLPVIGDVTGEGDVDGSDINTLINILLGKDSQDYNGRDNVDGEGGVDGSDLNYLINIVLGKVNPNQPQTEVIVANGVAFTMVTVEGGTYTMGATAEQGDDGDTDEFPTHQVTLSGFTIGETEVTHALWEAVMGSNHSRYSGDPQRPVDSVTWDECQEFITKLNEVTGLTFRLPTEAEWEFAARGGNKSNGFKYAGSNTIDDVAWYEDNSGTSSHAVATKAPNELGLYDMNGNVWEWCLDWYGDYSSDAQTDPTGPASGEVRVVRGGGWPDSAYYCRVTIRGGLDPSDAFSCFGLRLAR